MVIDGNQLFPDHVEGWRLELKADNGEDLAWRLDHLFAGRMLKVEMEETPIMGYGDQLFASISRNADGFLLRYDPRLKVTTEKL